MNAQRGGTVVPPLFLSPSFAIAPFFAWIARDAVWRPVRLRHAGRAFLFHEGFRAVGEAHHATVVRFLEIGLGRPQAATLALLDRMRRIRNQATYDAVGLISMKEAEEAVSTARTFVDDMARRLRARKT